MEIWSDKTTEINVENQSSIRYDCEGYVKKRNLSLVDEIPEGLLEEVAAEDKKLEEVPKKSKMLKKIIRRPLLKLAAPVLSLKNASWSRVLSSRQCLFLGDPLLENDAKIKMSIDKIE